MEKTKTFKEVLDEMMEDCCKTTDETLHQYPEPLEFCFPYSGCRKANIFNTDYRVQMDIKVDRI